MSDVTSLDEDKGWAWVVLAASVVILSSLSVFNTTIGIFQVEFLDSFDGSQGLVALIGSICLSSQFLYGPVVGIISDLVTHRVTIMIGAALVSVGLVSASFCQNLVSLLFLFGIVCGLGGGLCYSPAITVVSTYFHKYRTLASGISLAAPGVGLLVAPYLASWLIEEYGWRFAMVCYGCVMAQICVLASFFFPRHTHLTPCCHDSPRPADSKSPDVSGVQPPVQNGGLKVGQRAELGVMVRSRSMLKVSEFGSMMMSQYSVAWSVEDIRKENIRDQVKRVLRNRFLWVMSINQLLLIAGFSVTFILFPAYAQGVGLAVDDIPPIYIMYGVTVTLSRIVSGVVFSLIPDHLLKGLFVVQVGYAALLTMMPLLSSSFSSVLICMSFIGLTYGPSFGLLAPIIVRHVGLSDLPLAFGVVMLASGVGCVIAPPIAGVLYDIFGNYRVCFYVAGFTIAAAALSLLLLFFVKDRQPLEEDRFGKSTTRSSKQKETLLPACHMESDISSSDSAPVEPANEKPKVVIHEIDNEDALRELFRDRHG